MKTYGFEINDTFDFTNSKSNDINFVDSFLFTNIFSEEKGHINLSLDENDAEISNFFFQPPPEILNHGQNDISLFNFPEETDNFLLQNLPSTDNPSRTFIKKAEKINIKSKNDSDSYKNKFEIITKGNVMKYFRVDSAKKHFKVAVSQFATEQLNLLIKKSKLPKKLKKKIHLPHFKLFTSNPKEFDNFQFLSYDLKQILTLGKTDENLQGNNDTKISEIMEYKNYEKKKEIIEFLSLKYEDIIKLFYKSEKFQKFKKNEITKFFNEGIKKEKNISLLEDFGLIKLFKMTNKKRKREIFVSQ